MTLLDKLILVAGLVIFLWQVVAPIWTNKPVFPMVRKYMKKLKKRG